MLDSLIIRFKKLVRVEPSEGLLFSDKDVDFSLEKLVEYLGCGWVETYIEVYLSQNSDFSKLLTRPLDIVLLGMQLSSFKESLNGREFSKIIKKIQVICFGKNEQNNFQLLDVLSEIDLLSFLESNNLKDICIDQPTGKIGTKGGRINSDIYLSNSGIFFEVKRYNPSRQQYQKKFKLISDEFFSKPGSTGKHLIINRKNSYSTSVEPYNSSGSVASMQIPVTQVVNEIKELIKKCADKFIKSQNAVSIIDGLGFYNAENGNNAAKSFLNNNTTSPIKAVVVKTTRHWNPPDGENRDSVAHVFVSSGNQKIAQMFNCAQWKFTKVKVTGL